MAEPLYVTSGAASAGTTDDFATTVAVLIDLGTSGDIGLLAQGYLDGGAGLGEIPPITVGGTLTGGTTTGSGAGARNRDGTITGGTELTMESLIPGNPGYLGAAGAARAGRIAGLSLTGLQWVQLRAEYEGDPTSATKPLLLCTAWSGVGGIPAGTPVAAGTPGGTLSESVTTTANDVAVALLHVSAADANTFSPTSPTAQRLRALDADQIDNINGLIVSRPGLTGSTAMTGSFSSGGSVPYAGTKWVVQGITGGGATATVTGAGAIPSAEAFGTPTVTPTLPLYGIDFDNPALDLEIGNFAGTQVGLGLVASTDWLIRVRNVNTGAEVLSDTLTTNAAGVLPRLEDAALSSAVYEVVGQTTEVDPLDRLVFAIIMQATL